MSCSNIPVLILSDTFNTWFNRTNDIIFEINNLQIRTLSPFKDTSDNLFKGVEIIDLSDCNFSPKLSLGPFLGYYSEADASLYGSGLSASNPLRATIVFPTAEETEDGATFGLTWGGLSNDDRILINDVDDEGVPVKAIPAATFIPVAGPNIAITRNEFGNFVIQQVNTTFSPAFNASPSFSGTVYEIGHRTVRNNQTITFTIGRGSGNVNPISARITTNDTARIADYTPVTITDYPSGTGNSTSSSVSFPTDPDTWFNINLDSNRRIRFTASVTSDTQSVGDPVVPFSQTNVSLSRDYAFGWGFYGYSNNNIVDKLQVSGDFSGRVTFGSPKSNPTILNQYTFLPPSGGGNFYAYFIHSSGTLGGNSDQFGWSPRFRGANGDVLENAFVEITTTGPIRIDRSLGAYTDYRIWRSVEQYSIPITFQIGENTH
jgi:hypothetical protein